MKLTFGKHKGKTIDDIREESDESYLIWLHGQDFMKDDHFLLWKQIDNKIKEIEHDNYDPYDELNWYDFLK